VIAYNYNLIIISLNIILFSPWYSWNIAGLVGVKQQSITHSLKIPKLCRRWVIQSYL